MGMYIDDDDRNMRDEEVSPRRRKDRTENDASAEEKRNIRKYEKKAYALQESNLLQFKGRYNLDNMTGEEEEGFLQELSDMGILTRDDFGFLPKIEGNIYDVLMKQINSDILLLYKMAIAGRDDSKHIEKIKCRQKLLDFLEELKAV